MYFVKRLTKILKFYFVSKNKTLVHYNIWNKNRKFVFMWELRGLKNNENQSAAILVFKALQTHSSLFTTSIEVSLFYSSIYILTFLSSISCLCQTWQILFVQLSFILFCFPHHATKFLFISILNIVLKIVLVLLRCSNPFRLCLSQRMVMNEIWFKLKVLCHSTALFL